jgi:hypothetical protein
MIGVGGRLGCWTLELLNLVSEVTVWAAPKPCVSTRVCLSGRRSQDATTDVKLRDSTEAHLLGRWNQGATPDAKPRDSMGARFSKQWNQKATTGLSHVATREPASPGGGVEESTLA